MAKVYAEDAYHVTYRVNGEDLTPEEYRRRKDNDWLVFEEDEEETPPLLEVTMQVCTWRKPNDVQDEIHSWLDDLDGYRVSRESVEVDAVKVEGEKWDDTPTLEAIMRVRSWYEPSDVQDEIHSWLDDMPGYHVIRESVEVEVIDD